MKSTFWAGTLLLLISTQTQAQHHEHHAGHGAPAACTPEHAAMGHCTLPPETPRDPAPAAHVHSGHAAPACTPEHAAMGHCTPPPAAPSRQAPREPIPPLTDADRAAAFPVLKTAHHHASAVHWLARFDRLEAWDADPGSGQSWSGDFRYGGDIHRLRLAGEGERQHGALESASWYAHYSRSITPWWDLLAGARHDVKPDSRTWASLGVQGLAPYFFELTAMLHAGSGGQVQFTMEAEYELLLTNRLILQPLVEVTASLKNEADTGIGTGLGALETGLRLRYEITRRFAPYIGLVHERNFGRTADFARDNGQHVRDTRVVAGVRVWF